jgi:hypothetical protein
VPSEKSSKPEAVLNLTSDIVKTLTLVAVGIEIWTGVWNPGSVIITAGQLLMVSSGLKQSAEINESRQQGSDTVE